MVKQFQNVQNATAVTWKMLRVAEKTFRRVKHSRADSRVISAKQFIDGKQTKTEVIT